DYIIEPGSKAAIEAALRLKDAGRLAGDELPTVVALSLGESRADDALREALAMGCDEAYLLCDDAFHEADLSAVSAALAAAVAKLGGADLVLAGREAGDSGAGQVGPRLAEALGYAGVTDAYSLALEGQAVEAVRRWGEGYAAVRAPLPAVVSVAPEAFRPRYAHGARIMSAYRDWQVTTWGAAGLELDEEALKPLLAFRSEGFPPPLEVGEKFRGEPADVAGDVVMALKLQKLIGGSNGL
ncbi:MAG: electron transfer flavoprotein subunit beta/FixA family protein, partial [Anaerolineae bacterium]